MPRSTLDRQRIDARRTTATGDRRPLAEHLMRQIERLPRFTRVVSEFLVLSRKEYFTTREFEHVIAREPGLHDWLLRQANSGFFNLVRPVASVAEATVVIGLDQLKRMVYAACSRDLLGYRMRTYHFPGDGFWLHALGVGIVSHALKERIADGRALPGDEAMVAGLLHDVGKRILDPELIKRGGQRAITRDEEFSVAGIDHAELSARIAAMWNLPEAVVTAIRYHHLPWRDGQLLGGAALVYLAGALCDSWGLGKWTYAKLGHEPQLSGHRDLLSGLGLDTDNLHDLVDELRPTLAGLQEMLHACRSNPPGLAVIAYDRTTDEHTETTPGRTDPASAGSDRQTEPQSDQSGQDRTGHRATRAYLRNRRRRDR